MCLDGRFEGQEVIGWVSGKVFQETSVQPYVPIQMPEISLNSTLRDPYLFGYRVKYPII